MKVLFFIFLLSVGAYAQDDEGDEFAEFDSMEQEQLLESGTSPWSLSGYFELEQAANISGVGVHEELAKGHNFIISNQRLRLETIKTFIKGGVYAKFDFNHDAVTHYTEIDIRELRFQYRASDFLDLSVGRQISTWGVADMLFINDLFPKNWRANFTGRDMEMLKDPSNSLRLTSYINNSTVDLVYQPEFTPDVTPTGCRFGVYNPNAQAIVTNLNECSKYNPLDEKGDDLKGAEIAISIKTKIKDHELAFYAYDGFYKAPKGLISGSPLVGYHPGLQVFGVSDEGQWGPGIFTFEYGYYNSTEDKDGESYLIENSKHKYLVGYRLDINANLSVGGQWYQEKLQDYDKYKTGFFAANPAGYAYRLAEYRNTYTLRLTYKAQQETLWFNFFAYLRIEDEDSFSKFEVSKKFSDNFKLTVGLNIFTGKDNYLDREFGMLRADDNAFIRMNYSF
jgi:hypothetical protein